MTAISVWMLSNGARPVITYPGGYMISQCIVMGTDAHLEDRHTKSVYIRASRRKPLPVLTIEAKFLGIHHLRCHPPDGSPHSAMMGGASSG